MGVGVGVFLAREITAQTLHQRREKNWREVFYPLNHAAERNKCVWSKLQRKTSVTATSRCCLLTDTHRWCTPLRGKHETASGPSFYAGRLSVEYYVGSSIHLRFLVFVSNADRRLKCSNIPQENPDNHMKIPRPKMSVFCHLIKSLSAALLVFIAWLFPKPRNVLLLYICVYIFETANIFIKKLDWNTLF